MPDPDIELLAAALRRDSADLTLYARVLAETLTDSLPPGTVRVERTRTLADRLAGREGTVGAVDIALGEQRLSLQTHAGAATGEIRHEVRGIVLSRRPVTLEEWTDALARALAEAAASNARAREAVERFLT
ncbi:hypothetical protein [Streptomyces sp. NPDC099088]|uniref:hypothetical protein n=1 Tax=Streptomyces sp. NPDC099088 TaxID=3366101 RepID=UPI00380A50C4